MLACSKGSYPKARFFKVTLKYYSLNCTYQLKMDARLRPPGFTVLSE